MADPTDEAVTGPRRIQNNAATVEQHDLDKLIEYEKYKAGKDASAATGGLAMGGIRFQKTRHPSTY